MRKKQIIGAVLLGITLSLSACSDSSTNSTMNTVADSIATADNSVAVDGNSDSTTESTEEIDTETEEAILKLFNEHGVGAPNMKGHSGYKALITQDDGSTLALSVMYDYLDGVATMSWKDSSDTLYEYFSVNGNTFIFKDEELLSDEEAEKVDAPEPMDVIDGVLANIITSCEWKISGYSNYEHSLEETDDGYTVTKKANNLEVVVDFDKDVTPLDATITVQDKVHEITNFDIGDGGVALPTVVKEASDEYKALVEEANKQAEEEDATVSGNGVIEETDEDDIPEDWGYAYEEGNYRGTAQGYGGVVTADVTVDDSGNIAQIDVTAPDDSMVSQVEVGQVCAKILAMQSTEVDGVSGATVTSDAIKEAVKNALEEARIN